MQDLPSWYQVEKTVRETGSDDLADLIHDVRNRDLDDAWEALLPAVPDKDVRRLEQCDDDKRRRFIASSISRWRREPTANNLKATAVRIRLAMASAPQTAITPRTEPGQPGNQLALRHGWYSEFLTPEQVKMTRAWAEELISDLPQDAPVGSHSIAFGVADLRRHIMNLSRYLDQHGELDATGKPRPAFDKYLSAHRQHGSYLHQLGQTPRAQAAIRADTAAGARDLFAVRKQQRADFLSDYGRDADEQ